MYIPSADMHVSAFTPRQQLCNTSRYVTLSYLSTCECSHHTPVGQPGHANAPRHAQSVMGPECSNYHEGSELCNIANGHPINSTQRVLNNTEVKDNIFIIYRPGARGIRRNIS